MCQPYCLSSSANTRLHLLGTKQELDLGILAFQVLPAVFSSYSTTRVRSLEYFDLYLQKLWSPSADFMDFSWPHFKLHFQKLWILNLLKSTCKFTITIGWSNESFKWCFEGSFSKWWSKIGEKFVDVTLIVHLVANMSNFFCHLNIDISIIRSFINQTSKWFFRIQKELLLISSIASKIC